MALDSTTNATELTAEQVSTVLTKPVAAKSVFLSNVPEANIIDTAGPLRLPSAPGKTTPDWYGQNEQIVESDPSFDEFTLLPSTMKSVKVLTRFSNELARQSVVALDAALRARLVKDVADKIDAQLLSAGGDGVARPRGLFGYPGHTTVAVGGALTLDHLIRAEGALLDSVDSLDNLAWVMRGREFTTLRLAKDGAQRYQIQPDPTRQGAFTLLGHRVILTADTPDTTGGTPTARVGLVDFSKVYVARDVAPSVKILDQTFGDFDQQAIRVVARYDAGSPDPAKALVELTGITIPA